MRNDESFDLFWQKLISFSQPLDIEPSLPRALLCEVCTVMKLVLIMSATNASSEHSFTALHRVKNYLRNTMGQERLNHLMVIALMHAISY